MREKEKMLVTSIISLSPNGLNSLDSVMWYIESDIRWLLWLNFIKLVFKTFIKLAKGSLNDIF